MCHGRRVLPLLFWVATFCVAHGGVVDQQITLRECIETGLRENLELEIERIQPLFGLADQRTARGAFEPEFRLEGSYDKNTRLLDATRTFDTLIDTESSQRREYSAGLTGLLPTGARWELSADNQSVESSRIPATDYDSSVGLTLTQPLLRGFGSDVNLAELRVARSATAEAQAAFETRVAQFLVDVTAAYYELAFARLDFLAQQESAELARQLLDDNRSRVEIGASSPLDITQARSELAARQQEAIAAELAIIEAENALRRLLYRDVVEHLERRLVPVETGLPVSAAFDPEEIFEAYTTRPELREGRERVAQAEFQLKRARNATLPALDLRGTLRANGSANEFGSSVPRSEAFNDPAWGVGIVVEIPLGNSAERGRRDRATLELAQAKLNFAAQRQDIAVEISNAAGAVRVNEKRYAAAVESAKFAREALDAEVEKLNAGATTTFVVTQLQRDLAVARSSELRAIADWHQSAAEYDRVRGRIFERFNIRFVPRDNLRGRRAAR